MDVSRLRPKHLRDCEWDDNDIRNAIKVLQRQLQVVRNKRRARKHPLHRERGIVGYTKFGKPIIEI